MSRGINSFIGKRLTIARKARGISGVSLAGLLNVSASTISQYEHDDAKPTSEMHERISSVLNFPLDFFQQQIVDRTAPQFFYRSISAATKAERARAESLFDLLYQIVSYLERYLELPKLNIPDFEIPGDYRNLSDDQIELYAAETRKFWNLDDGPAPHIVRLLEKNGLIISRFLFETDTLDAFSESLSWKHPFLILGRDKTSSVRLRWDAAHELAHCILHKKITKGTGLMQDHAIQERQAHRFAGAFLMPQESFSKELILPTLDEFLSIKPRWGVSIAAMITRSQQLNFITEDQAKRLWINMSRRGWRKQEPYDDKIQIEEPKLLRQCIDALISNGVKGRSQIAKEIGLHPNDIEGMCELPNGYLDDNFGEIINFPIRAKS